jgi:hypothetical protein
VQWTAEIDPVCTGSWVIAKAYCLESDENCATYPICTGVHAGDWVCREGMGAGLMMSECVHVDDCDDITIPSTLPPLPFPGDPTYATWETTYDCATRTIGAKTQTRFFECYTGIVPTNTWTLKSHVGTLCTFIGTFDCTNYPAPDITLQKIWALCPCASSSSSSSKSSSASSKSSSKSSSSHSSSSFSSSSSRSSSRSSASSSSSYSVKTYINTVSLDHVGNATAWCTLEADPLADPTIPIVCTIEVLRLK